MEPLRESIARCVTGSFPREDDTVTTVVSDRWSSPASALVHDIITNFSPPSGVGREREVRRINPPKLDGAHLGKNILCYRPMRHGAPNLSIQRSDYGHVVAHNYGHGGSGWTMGPGSALHVIESLERSFPDLTKDCPITIIGAGVSGLFSAYFLVQKGYQKITIIADQFENLTSHNAGGLLAPVSMDNAPEMQEVIDRIGVTAYEFYQAIAEKRHPEFAEGACIVPTYFRSREKSGLEPYVAAKVMQAAKDVLLDFGNGTTKEMVAYDDGIFIDTAKMMTALTDYLKERISFVQRRISAISEIEQEYVINCSGLGARELNQDEQMVPVQGHLIMLKGQRAEDLQYMILDYSDVGITHSGQTVQRSFYLFPKKMPDSGPHDIGVIGGTFIEGATPETPNYEEFDRLLDGAKRFYGISSADALPEEHELLDGARRYYGPSPFGTPIPVSTEREALPAPLYEEPDELFYGKLEDV